MFEALSTEALQVYWWFIVSILGGALLMLSFVQGGQSLLWQLAPPGTSRDLVVNALGRKWELTFTTLVTFGGALFAAFPLFYATSFGGAYWVWMAILLCFILQAVAYEYRKRPHNFLGTKVYETFLFINGSLGMILLGAAIGTLFSGAPFTVDEQHLSHWAGPARGLSAVGEPFNVAMGLLLLFLSRALGALFLMHEVDDDSVAERARTILTREAPVLVLLVLVVLGMLFTRDGMSFDPATGVVTTGVGHKYLDNLLALPVRGLVFLLLGAMGLLGGIFLGFKGNRTSKPFWMSAGGTLLIGVSLLSLAGLNDTPFYPSLADAQSSLTIHNASSSRFTLVVMSYVSLMVPFVIAYIAVVWRKMSATPIRAEEIERDPMSY